MLEALLHTRENDNHRVKDMNDETEGNIQEALNYAVRISDYHITDKEAVAYAAEHWKLEFEVLWKAWVDRFRREV